MRFLRSNAPIGSDGRRDTDPQSDVRRHATLHFTAGEAARCYNTLQKIACLIVLIILIPTLVLTGFTMSPAINAAWP